VNSVNSQARHPPGVINETALTMTLVNPQNRHKNGDWALAAVGKVTERNKCVRSRSRTHG